MEEALIVQEGQQVPDFTLPASNGKPFQLSKYRGKRIVIYFYPQNMTPTCTEEACHFRDGNNRFKRYKTRVIGISPDDLKSHSKFSEKYELPFLLLSDPEHTICEMFEVWKLKKLYGREYMGVERSTFLIDEEGILVKEWRKVRIKGHVEAVLEAVKELDKQRKAE